MTDRVAQLAEHAAEFLSFEAAYGGSSEAARLTTRHTLADVAADLGFAPDEIGAAIDAAIATAGGESAPA